MSEPTRQLRLIVLAAIVLCLVASLTGARAGQEKSAAPGLKVAMVDEDRVFNEYTYTSQAQGELTKRKNEEVLKLRVWAGNQLLSAAEQDELANLAITEQGGALTDAQKARKQALLQQSKSMDDEYLALKNKKVADVTAQDDAKLKAYVNADSTTAARVKEEQAKGEAEIGSKLTEAQKKVRKDIREAVAKVAKEKGVNVVLASVVAMYADSDITDAVVSVLNKGLGK